MRGTLLTSTGDVAFNLAWINNPSATTNPGVNDDVTAGYAPGSIWINTSAKTSWVCISAADGAAVWNETGSQGDAPGTVTAPAASTPTGNGGNAAITGGAGGTTSGAGGNSSLVGGAATAGNSNGGDAIVAGGAKAGTGVVGNAVIRSTLIVHQGAQATQDTAATLTAAQLLAGILTSNPSGAVNLQLPLATDLDAALPNTIAGDAFDFSVISLAGSTNLPTLTINTGWTLVGAVVFTAVAGNAGRFRARKTATGAWTLYRIG